MVKHTSSEMLVSIKKIREKLTRDKTWIGKEYENRVMVGAGSDKIKRSI